MSGLPTGGCGGEEGCGRGGRSARRVGGAAERLRVGEGLPAGATAEGRRRALRGGAGRPSQPSLAGPRGLGARAGRAVTAAGAVP